MAASFRHRERMHGSALSFGKRPFLCLHFPTFGFPYCVHLSCELFLWVMLDFCDESISEFVTTASFALASSHRLRINKWRRFLRARPSWFFTGAEGKAGLCNADFCKFWQHRTYAGTHPKLGGFQQHLTEGRSRRRRAAYSFPGVVWCCCLMRLLWSMITMMLLMVMGARFSFVLLSPFSALVELNVACRC